MGAGAGYQGRRGRWGAPFFEGKFFSLLLKEPRDPLRNQEELAPLSLCLKLEGLYANHCTNRTERYVSKSEFFMVYN